MILVTAGVFAAAFLVGTAAHELTHWAVALAVGARIDEVWLFPPNPRVVYEPATARSDRWVRASTIVAALPLCVAAGLVALSASPVVAGTALVAVAGYLPRSRSDWSGLSDVLKCIAGE